MGRERGRLQGRLQEGPSVTVIGARSPAPHSHVSPWSQLPQRRVRPQAGLCFPARLTSTEHLPAALEAGE